MNKKYRIQVFRNVSLILILTIYNSCGNNSKNELQSETSNFISVTLSAEEKSTISNSAIDFEIARILKFHTKNELKPLKIGNEYGELSKTDSLGLLSIVNSNNKFEILQRIINDVNSNDYSFICYFDDYDRPYIAVINEDDDLNFITKRGTHAINYNMYSIDLKTKLEDWKQMYNFDLIGVSSDFIDIKFQTPPKQTEEFKSMVGEFCPDAIDWVNSEESMLLMKKNDVYLNLWWD